MKVCLVSLGCARTLVDSEVALGSLKKEGYDIVQDVAKADIAVVNTCGFIEAAKIESIETILGLCEFKKKGRLAAVVVLGCLAQRHGEELKKELKEVDAIIGTDSYEDLPRLLEPLRAGRKKIYAVKDKPRYLLSDEAPRVSLTPDHYAYVKISEGCINACSYCVIPKMKGPHRSRTVDSILSEIKKASSERPLREINLIGQDTAAFGFDRTRQFELPTLLRAIDRQGLVPWVRLLYAHPGHVTDELIAAMAESSTVCKYVDFPIEHSHDDMLRRMNRGVTREKMVWGIQALRRAMPDVSIRTTVIVGFPGETDEEFNDLLDFLKEYRFDRLGAFEFSEEEGARAYGRADQISPEVKKARFDAVMALQQEISQSLNQAQVGKRLRVLVDEADPEEPGVYLARSQADAPEVDGQVFVHSQRSLATGEFIDVEVTDALEYDLIGAPAG